MADESSAKEGLPVQDVGHHCFPMDGGYSPALASSGDAPGTAQLRTLSLSEVPHSLPIRPTRSQMGKRWSLASVSSSSGYDSASIPWHASGTDDGDLLTVDRAYSDHDMSDRSSRSRSISPYYPTGHGYNVDMLELQNLFRVRYPKAIEQMEFRLKQFQIDLSLHEAASHKDAAVNFVATQLLSLTKDLLDKSEAGAITMQVFQSITENLSQLNEDNIRRGATPETFAMIQKLLQQMTVIITRPAGLLECLEQDMNSLDAHGQVKSPAAAGGGVLQMLAPPMSCATTSCVPSPASNISDSSHLLHYVRQCLTPRDCLSRDRRLSAVKSEDEGDDDGSEDGDEAVTELASQDVQPKADDFEQLKIISNGAYGSVYLVRHKERRQVFAMKKITKTNVIRKKNLDQVYAERNILTFANNPFVVGLWCTFETKKHFCMVLEYVEGGDCAALLKNIGGPLPTDLARLYVAETVLALEYLHNYGIVHRDLKPDNMLITSLGHIKLTDFGLSRVGIMSYATSMYEEGMSANQVFNDEQVFGTPDYIAPEVILRQGYGPPVDWWALGVVLYQFLIGDTPFIGSTVEELFEQITDETVLPEFPTDFPFSEEGKEIISDLLIRDPQKRLGAGTCNGVADVKNHVFFNNVDWRNLLLQKAEFIPQLDHEEDTSYFDPRTDRYDHTLIDSDNEGDEDCLYSNFMSMSPSFSRILTPPLSHQSSINRSDSDLSDVSSHDTSSSLTSSPYHAWRPTDLDASSQHSSATSTSVEPASSVSSTPELSSGSLERPTSLTTTPRRGSLSASRMTPEAIVVVPPPLTTAQVAMATALATMTSSQMSGGPMNSGVHASGTAPVSLGSLAAFNRHSGLDRPIRLARRRQSLDETSARLRSRLASLGPRLSDNSNIGQAGGYGNTAYGANSTSSLATSGTNVAALAPLQALSRSGGGSSSSSYPASLNTSGYGQSQPGLNVSIPARCSVGMSLKAIRVFLGTSDNYVLQHVIKDVVEGSPSWVAGIRPEHLLTHIDGLPVVGLKHTDVVQLLSNNRKQSTTVQMVPMSNTGISHKNHHRQSSNAKRLSSKHERKLTRTSSTGSSLKKKLAMIPRLSKRHLQRNRDQVDSPAASQASTGNTVSASPAAASTAVSPVAAAGTSPIMCAKANISLHQRIVRAIQPRRPSITSLMTPMSPLATVSQTSPQHQLVKSHTALRRTASVGSPFQGYRRLSRTPPRHEQHSVSLRNRDRVPLEQMVAASLAPSESAGTAGTASTGDTVADGSAPAADTKSPRRNRLRRNELTSKSTTVRKSSE
eukprot:scpid3849/ scgid2613/ Microtubule-associated serine/threonine-protein kinase 1; Syntrophin-associated serine/threonine-protein kinase